MKLSYIESESPLHRLNPLVKIGWVTAMSMAAIIINHPVLLAILFLATLPWVAAGRIWRAWFSLMRLAILLCLTITIITMAVNHNGEHVLWQAAFKLPVLGYPAITVEALLFSLAMCFRLLTIISAFAILTLAVHPDDVLQVMYKVHIPRKTVLVAALAVRFLPLLISDAERISAAQQARGWRPGLGGPLQRIKNGAAVLTPLLSNSLDRSIALAEAMESRAFGSGRRTFYKPLRIPAGARLALALVVGLMVLTAVLAALGWTSFRFYPSFGALSPDLKVLISANSLLVLAVVILPAGKLSRRPGLD